MAVPTSRLNRFRSLLVSCSVFLETVPAVLIVKILLLKIGEHSTDWTDSFRVALEVRCCNRVWHFPRLDEVWTVLAAASKKGSADLRIQHMPTVFVVAAPECSDM
jgi:hypothetical protein